MARDQRLLPRRGGRVFRTYFVDKRGDEQMGNTWNYLDITALGRQEIWEDSPEGYPQTPPYGWWNRHDEYERRVIPLAPRRRHAGRGAAAGAGEHRREPPRRPRLAQPPAPPRPRREPAMTDAMTLRIERTFQAPAEASSRPGPARRCCAAGSTPSTPGRPPRRRSTSASAAPSAWSCATPTRAATSAAAAPTPRSTRPTASPSPGPGTTSSDRETLIELDFDEADGPTTVLLTHSGLRDHEAVVSHEGGWSNALDNLGEALATDRRRSGSRPLGRTRAAVNHAQAQGPCQVNGRAAAIAAARGTLD